MVDPFPRNRVPCPGSHVVHDESVQTTDASGVLNGPMASRRPREESHSIHTSKRNVLPDLSRVARHSARTAGTVGTGLTVPWSRSIPWGLLNVGAHPANAIAAATIHLRALIWSCPDL
jgi:hypothetical protein